MYKKNKKNSEVQEDWDEPRIFLSELHEQCIYLYSSDLTDFTCDRLAV